MNRLKILSINVRGLGSAGKSEKIAQELNHLNCDIIFLQETHVSCKNRLKNLKKSGKVNVIGLLGPVNLPVLLSFSRQISPEILFVFLLILVEEF